jgi:hypothetical protein
MAAWEKRQTTSQRCATTCKHYAAAIDFILSLIIAIVLLVSFDSNPASLFRYCIILTSQQDETQQKTQRHDTGSCSVLGGLYRIGIFCQPVAYMA